MHEVDVKEPSEREKNSGDNIERYRVYYFSKRLIDLVLSLVGLVILSPVIIVISCCYLYGDNRGPIFFKQIRIGKDGEEFFIYKFRSMVVNAEERLKKDEALYKKYVQNNYKLEPNEDPRITRFGEFLRKTSLDEIPQLYNVLLGNMSLVGPRPVVKNELVEYKEKKEDFLSVKPGITGYWQVSGRSNVGYPERVDIELHYVYNKSLKLDIKIIAKTFVAVFLKRGAY